MGQFQDWRDGRMSGRVPTTAIMMATLMVPCFFGCASQITSVDETSGDETSGDETSTEGDVSTDDPADDIDFTTGFTTGLTEHILVHDKEDRLYLLYVPQSYDGTQKVPLMLNFHGFGDSAQGHMAWADMRDLAEEENFILVYPEGTLLDGYTHWNAGLDTPENKSDAEDFTFTEVLVESLSSTHNIDADRIYACGYSNGAFFAYSLACYNSDIFAAIGSVSGTMMEETYDNCDPTHPTGMINLHGTADHVVPYGGGSDGLVGIDSVLSYWADLNSIDTSPVIDSINDNGMTIEYQAYSGASATASVDHYKIMGGDHVWFDIEYDGADTNRLIWDFVSRHDINGLR